MSEEIERVEEVKEKDDELIDLICNKKGRINTCVYVDYENIIKQLSKHRIRPEDINFFEKIKEILESKRLNLVDFIMYANYDDAIFPEKCEMQLQRYGFQTRHTSSIGKNTADLEMTADALKTLYKNCNIEVFVIISCDRDFIPLIREIKSENKIAYVISTKTGFNKVVSIYADEHDYIEDLFEIEMIKFKTIDNKEEIIVNVGNKSKNSEKIIINDIEKFCKVLFSTKIWNKYIDGKEKEVSINGISKILVKLMGINYSEIDKLLEMTKDLNYIKFNLNEDRKRTIEKGIKYEEFVSNIK